METKYYFYNEKMSLVEIKKDSTYHWLLIDNNTKDIKKLTFIFMDDGLRKFEEGKLMFNSIMGNYNKNILNVGETLPICLEYNILEFLKK